jgi:hypothetical protein
MPIQHCQCKLLAHDAWSLLFPWRWISLTKACTLFIVTLGCKKSELAIEGLHCKTLRCHDSKRQKSIESELIMCTYIIVTLGCKKSELCI